MLKRILTGYGQIFSSMLKALLLLAVCVAAGAAFVYPLWYFATKLPRSYTLCVSLVFIAAFILWAVSKARGAGMRRTLLFLAKFLIIAGTAALFVVLVLSGKRILALPLVIAALAVYGLVSFAAKSEPRGENPAEDEEIPE